MNIHRRYKYLRYLLAFYVLLSAIILLYGCSASSRAKHQREKDMEQLESLLAKYPQLQDTTVITVIDTLYIPTATSEIKIEQRVDTIWINKVADTITSKLEGFISEAQKLTLSTDIKSILVDRPILKDTIIYVDDYQIDIHKDGRVIINRKELKKAYSKEETKLQVQPIKQEKQKFYESWWFALLIVAILYVAYQTRKK